MRNRKAFFLAAIAAAPLIGGTLVMAGGAQGTSSTAAAIIVPPSPAPPPPPPLTCFAGDFQFTVSSGPTFVDCDAVGGQCTQIEYHVSPRPDGDVLALEGVGVVSVSGDRFVAAPCIGLDNGFGQGSCHEQAIQTTLDDSGNFTITLAGLRAPAPTSVGTSAENACRILGIGLEAGPNPAQEAQTTETVNFKGCMVQFTRDAVTGEVLQAQLLKKVSPSSCQGPFVDGDSGVIAPQPVAALEVKLKDGTSLGKGKFGDGYISTGNESCTTRVIGGRVYTWGTQPCP
jgi:hypothetical protein